MKTKILLLGLFLILCSFPVSRDVYAAVINTFTVSPGSVFFVDQDPDLGQVTSSPGLSVTISISGLQQNQDWTLDMYADSDLENGGNTIPVRDIQWKVTGSGNPTPVFYNGTLVKGVYVTAAQGKGNKKYEVDVTVAFYFLLQNSWSYSTGNYGGKITLRLSAAGGASQTQTVTLSTNIATRAKLIFRSSAVSFSSANPDSVPSVPANINPVSVISSARTGSSQSANLTCLASGDLISGTSAIAIKNISWKATGAGYQPGVMNSLTSQNSGTWIGPGQYTGTFSYFLANSWSYTIGDYTTSVNYTLTIP
jgi:hypothetical protein